MAGPVVRGRPQAKSAIETPAPSTKMEPIIPQLDGTQNASTDTPIKPPSFTCDSELNAPVTTIDPEQLTTDSLKKLQSTDERQLLDVVDKLRRTGLNGTIELPQLVVCGDQSSGKSSVLEAITEIPFPRKAGLCTRFATEIVLRRQPASSVTIRINPSKLRTEGEKTKLSAFRKNINNLGMLPVVMEEATHAMGLGKVGESKAFSRDVLSVEICGPDRPQLTLVDLPGLIHSATKSSTEADKALIFSLVEEYMQNPRTIILAVVSAKNDVANQIVLNLARKVDQKGSRTLGIITKPDCIAADDETSWFDLAQNKEIFLQLGWHMVKNRMESEMHLSFADRNMVEKAFFCKGRFANLNGEHVGVEALRDRLSKLLLRHLVQELPSLKQEMMGKLTDTKRELDLLGQKRETPTEQRMMLMTISMQVHQILTVAVHGNYLHPFFGPADLHSPIDAPSNIRRFRAVIQSFNFEFAETMRRRGHTYEFIKEGASSIQFLRPEESDDGVATPIFCTRDEAIEWVNNTILRCRGHELPGSVNPEVTSHLFREQSQPWEDIANGQISDIADLTHRFIEQVLDYAVPAELRQKLADINVNATLNDAYEAGVSELNKLIADKLRHPSTYNHYYSDVLQTRRQDKYQNMSEKAQEASTKYTIRENGTTKANLDAAKFKTAIAKLVQRDMDMFSAEEALESQIAYYKDEMKYFVHAVTKQVIERCMIDPLPSKILSPMVVTAMTDEEVSFVAAEPPETVAQRAFLEERKQMLEKGFEIFREATGGMGGAKRSRHRGFGS